MITLVVVAVMVIFFGAWSRVRSGPPRKITFAAGSRGGAYFEFAEKYKELLAQSGLEVEILQTKGSRENLELLESGEADIAFVQSGLKGKDGNSLESLGCVFYEPVWVFVHGPAPQNGLLGLKGKRLAIGAEGSGTREVAQTLLLDNKLNNHVETFPLSGEKAKEEFLAGEVDAVFMVGSPRVKAIRELAHREDVHLLDFKRARAYSRYHTSLSAVPLYQGMLNLAEDIPPHQHELVATAANLVVSEKFHYALSTLVLQTAREVHEAPGPFHDYGEFPSPKMATFPLVKEAESFYRRGPSFFFRNLPFYPAAALDRLVILLVPLLTLIVPLGRLLPPLYGWFLKRKIYKLQDRVTEIEMNEENLSREDQLRQLKELEGSLMDAKSLPPAFQNDLFLIQLRIERAEERLNGTAAEKSAGPEEEVREP